MGQKWFYKKPRVPLSYVGSQCVNDVEGSLTRPPIYYSLGTNSTDLLIAGINKCGQHSDNMWARNEPRVKMVAIHRQQNRRIKYSANN